MTQIRDIVYREFGPLLMEAHENKNFIEHDELRKIINMFSDAIIELNIKLAKINANMEILAKLLPPEDKLEKINTVKEVDKVLEKDKDKNTQDIIAEKNKLEPYEWTLKREGTNETVSQ